MSTATINFMQEMIICFGFGAIVGITLTMVGWAVHRSHCWLKCWRSKRGDKETK